VAAPPLQILATNPMRNALGLTIRVNNTLSRAQHLTVAWNYFPAWRAVLDDVKKPLRLAPEPQTGLLGIEGIPPGRHLVQLWYDSTPAQHLGKWLSALAWMFYAAILIDFFRTD
jgi:hypothetical protein